MMNLIDGIGDEVLLVLFSLFLGLLIVAIWFSTAVTNENPVVSVTLPVTLTLPSHEEEDASFNRVESAEDEPPDPPDNSANSEVENGFQSVDNVPPTTHPTREKHDEESSANNPQEGSSDSGAQSSFRIKLKFLNEDVKEVNGNGDESVGLFKAKHFAADIADNKLVRLIFNGQVLNRDGRTLRQCGLFDNCVVHCLIHNKRPDHNESRSGGSVEPPPVADLDLSSICYPLVGSILSLIWWCQLIYGQYFNWTSTISLIGITGLYFFSLSSLYYG